MRVVQDGVRDGAETWRASVPGVPADDHQVGAGGQDDERPARMAVHNVLAVRLA